MDSLVYKETWIKALKMPHRKAARFLLREAWLDIKTMLLMLACPAFFVVMLLAISATH